MMDTGTVYGFALAGSLVVHWVSPITPNFQGSAHVNETPINIVDTKTNANSVLKHDIFFIICPLLSKFLNPCLS